MHSCRVEGFGPSQAAGSPLPLPAPSSADDGMLTSGDDPQRAAPRVGKPSQDTPGTVPSRQQGPVQMPTPLNTGQQQDTPQTQVAAQRRVVRLPAQQSGGRSEEGTPQTCVAVQRRVAQAAAALTMASDGGLNDILTRSCATGRRGLILNLTLMMTAGPQATPEDLLQPAALKRGRTSPAQALRRLKRLKSSCAPAGAALSTLFGVSTPIMAGAARTVLRQY